MASSNGTIWKRHLAENMVFRWQFMADRLVVKLQARTHGWLAIGFNTQDWLQGTNLIMGAVFDDRTVTVEDRYIVEPARRLHQRKTELGAVSRIEAITGSRSGAVTTIAFRLPTHSTDAYSYDVLPGKAINVLLAYSRATDFQHHSRVRTHQSIIL